MPLVVLAEGEAAVGERHVELRLGDRLDRERLGTEREGDDQVPVLAFERGLRGFGLLVQEVLPRVPVQDLRRERDDLRPGEVLRRRGGALGELAEPDVAVPHGVVVILE